VGNPFFRPGERAIGEPSPLKVLSAKFPKRYKTREEIMDVYYHRMFLMRRIRKDLSQTPEYLLGGKLGHFLNRWEYVGGRRLVRCGIMANYIDKEKALEYWSYHKKYREFRTNSQKMREAYDKKFSTLIQHGTVEEVPYNRLLWINPTNLVPKPNGDFRLVIDTRKVNQFMVPIHFKMEGVSTLEQCLKKNEFAITYDLKEAYNHIPVHPSMRPLLGVAWRGRCYQSKGMPFGLNDAPRVFSQIMSVQLKPETGKSVKYSAAYLPADTFSKTDENEIISESDRYFIINPSSISQSISLPNSVEPIKDRGGGQIRMEWPISTELFNLKRINAVEKIDKENEPRILVPKIPP
jgi:hypothetical protein